LLITPTERILLVMQPESFSQPVSRRGGTVAANVLGLAALLLVLAFIAWPLGVATSFVWHVFLAGWSVSA
jgi:hypothetical protein